MKLRRIAIGLCVLGSLSLVPIRSDAAFPLCGFHWLTGRPCPLCGLTRALAAILHGEWGAALSLHALSPLAMALLVALIAGVPSRRIPWGATAAVFAAFGAIRIAVG